MWDTIISLWFGEYPKSSEAENFFGNCQKISIESMKSLHGMFFTGILSSPSVPLNYLSYAVQNNAWC